VFEIRKLTINALLPDQIVRVPEARARDALIEVGLVSQKDHQLKSQNSVVVEICILAGDPLMILPTHLRQGTLNQPGYLVE